MHLKHGEHLWKRSSIGLSKRSPRPTQLPKPMIITKEEFPKSDAWHFHNSKSIDPNVPVCQKMFVLKNADDDDAIHLLLGCVLYITHPYHDYHPSKG